MKKITWNSPVVLTFALISLLALVLNGVTGGMSNRHVSLHTVDIGLAQLAMHSCMETAGVKDTEYLIRAMKVFFSSSFAEKGNSFLI